MREEDDQMKMVYNPSSKPERMIMRQSVIEILQS